MLKIIISPDDKNADWLKTIVNPETGKTYREEELAIHDALAQQTTVKHQPGHHNQRSHGRVRKLGGAPTGKEPTNPLSDPNSAENTEARANWKNLSHEQKMALLDPDAINESMARTLGKYRESASFLYQFEEGQATDATSVGQLRGNAFSYLKTLEPALTPGTRKRMAEYVDMYSKALKEAVEDGSLPKGVKAADVNEMMLDNVDKMVYQESETRKRQLGDHGIRHVTGNIENAHKMLDQLDGTTGFDKLLAAQVMVDHDMGYTAGVVQKSFEATKYHELFSEKYARSEDEQYKKVFGDRTDELYNAIATHADFDLDWKGQPTLSAIRTADNLALFSRDKLPALFMDVPGATTTLYKLQLAKSVGQDAEMLPKVKEELNRLIDNTSLDERVKAELHSAAEEVMPLTGKFTLGMLAGEIEDFSYDGEKMEVGLASKPEREVLNGLFDLGDRQFEKFLENYNQEGAAGEEGVDLLEKDSGQRVLKVKFKDQDTTVANRELVELNEVSVRPIIHKVVGALGENPDQELRDKVWKNLEKPLSERLTKKELADFRKRYYGTDLLGFPLSVKERTYLETEWKEKHLAGRHDQKSHGHEHGGGISGSSVLIPDISNTRNYKKVKPLTDAGLAYMGEAYKGKLTVDEYKQQLEEIMRSELASSDIKVRMSESVLKKVLRDGEIKNTFETGKSSSAYREAGISYRGYLDYRKELEENMFGVEEHPTYGYFEREEGALKNLVGHYGDVAITLKSEVKDRSTFTDADSLDWGQYNRFIPSPVNNPSYYSSLYFTNYSDPLAVWKKGINYGGYTEAQIFGKVGVADIDRVTFYKAPDSKTTDELDRRGIKWSVK